MATTKPHDSEPNTPWAAILIDKEILPSKKRVKVKTPSGKIVGIEIAPAKPAAQLP